SHIGPRLVEEKDDPERDADFLDAKPVWPNAPFTYQADRIRKRCDLPQALGGRLDSLRSELEPVAGRGGEIGRDFEVARVRGEDLVRLRDERIGRLEEPAILGRTRDGRELVCSGTGSNSQIAAEFGERQVG